MQLIFSQRDGLLGTWVGGRVISQLYRWELFRWLADRHGCKREFSSGKVQGTLWELGPELM